MVFLFYHFKNGSNVRCSFSWFVIFIILVLISFFKPFWLYVTGYYELYIHMYYTKIYSNSGTCFHCNRNSIGLLTFVLRYFDNKTEIWLNWILPPYTHTTHTHNPHPFVPKYVCPLADSCHFLCQFSRAYSKTYHMSFARSLTPMYFSGIWPERLSIEGIGVNGAIFS